MGEVILLTSFVSMIAGIWFSNSSNNKKPIPIAMAGSIVLYVSMYVYYSIALEIAGMAILAFAYVFIYSHRVARVAKLT